MTDVEFRKQFNKLFMEYVSHTESTLRTPAILLASYRVSRYLGVPQPTVSGWVRLGGSAAPHPDLREAVVRVLAGLAARTPTED